MVGRHTGHCSQFDVVICKYRWQVKLATEKLVVLSLGAIQIDQNRTTRRDNSDPTSVLSSPLAVAWACSSNMPRLNNIDLLLLAAILLPDLATATVSLSQFQAIVGFPQACTNAYQTPVTACTASDFSNGAPCSANCISGLQQITTSINAACQGSKANPDSLIGLFFQNKGVDSLCPNSGDGDATSTTSRSSTTLTQVTIGGSSSSTSGTTAQITTSTSAAVRTTSSSSTEASSTDISTSGASSTTSRSTQTSTTAQSTLQITGGSSTSTTSVSRNTAGFTTTVFNQGEASVITSKPEQTGSNNPEAFGGGGSPFEVGPNSSSASRTSDLLPLHFAATLAAAFLLAVGLS